MHLIEWSCRHNQPVLELTPEMNLSILYRCIILMMNFAFAIFFIGKHFAMNWDSTIRIVCRRIGNYWMHRGRKSILYQAIWSKCEWLIFTRRWNGKMKCPEWNCVLRYENDARTNLLIFLFLYFSFLCNLFSFAFNSFSLHFHLTHYIYYWRLN